MDEEINFEQIEKEMEKFNSYIEKMLTSNKNGNNRVKKFKFLSDEEDEKVVNQIKSLDINKRVKMHRVLEKYKDTYNKYKKERNPDYAYYQYKDKLEFLRRLSDEGRERMIRILNHIFNAIEELGGEIKDDYSLKVRGEKIEIEIKELKDTIPHEITEEEKKALQDYKVYKDVYNYHYPPKIPQFDYVYNGKIKMKFGFKNTIRESSSGELEKQLDEIMTKIYEQSEVARNERLNEEEKARIKQEEEKKAEERRRLIAREQLKVKQLLMYAEDFENACKIRRFINELEKNEYLTEEKTKYINWAREKADWIDPCIERKDELLGIRNHNNCFTFKEERSLRSYEFF